jgi:hypothetical protein
MIRGALPPETAIPVRFVHTVDVYKAKPGDLIRAKTLQVITLPDGMELPKGTVVTGHVVEAQPLRLGPAGAEPQASRLSIHFDQIVHGDATLPVNLSVRALANTLDSDDAENLHYIDESFVDPSVILIGGDEFSPLDKTIKGEDGQVIGYHRRQGVFAPLLDSYDDAPGSNLTCHATRTEQSVSIFSPRACGLYGFVDESLPHTGRRGSGTFTLESRDHSVTLYAGATALLQETAH